MYYWNIFYFLVILLKSFSTVIMNFEFGLNSKILVLSQYLNKNSIKLNKTRYVSFDLDDRNFMILESYLARIQEFQNSGYPAIYKKLLILIEWNFVCRQHVLYVLLSFRLSSYDIGISDLDSEFWILCDLHVWIKWNLERQAFI